MWTVVSIVGALCIIALVLYCLVRAEKKEAHHLDRLHIVSDEDKKK